MKEPLTIAYLVLGIVFTGIFLWSIYSKMRKLDWWTLLHVVTMLFVSAAAGCILTTILKDSLHLSWVSRIGLLGIGFALAWGVYKLGWSQRHPFDFQQDSFQTEFCFVVGVAAFMGILYLNVPMWWNAQTVLNWKQNYWDAGVLLTLPFLLHKTWDAFTQITYPDVENPWTFPDQFINTESWKWRELAQINFEIAKNLDSESNLFQKPITPWIEVPKEQPIGTIFALMIQERRKNPALATINDLGIEYSGQPRFWLLFSIKKVWWKPSTWNRTNRHLYPDLSVVQNEVQANDVIVVQRIPFSSRKHRPNELYATPAYDTGKTMVISR